MIKCPKRGNQKKTEGMIKYKSGENDDDQMPKKRKSEKD